MHMYKYFAFYYFLLTLLLPNFILSFTEQLSLAGALTNILLPAGIIRLFVKPFAEVRTEHPADVSADIFAAFRLSCLISTDGASSRSTCS